MPQKTTLQDLILEATDHGYDVMVSFKLRDDGLAGELKIPTSWAKRLGVLKADANE